MEYTRGLQNNRFSITTGSPAGRTEGHSMWLIGLELGLVAVLLAIVGLALRSPRNKDSDSPPHD